MLFSDGRIAQQTLDVAYKSLGTEREREVRDTQNLCESKRDNIIEARKVDTQWSSLT